MILFNPHTEWRSSSPGYPHRQPRRRAYGYSHSGSGTSLDPRESLFTSDNVRRRGYLFERRDIDERAYYSTSGSPFRVEQDDEVEGSPVSRILASSSGSSDRYGRMWALGASKSVHERDEE
jgi:hypothetical protein